MADVTEIGDKTGCTNVGIAVHSDSETPETQHEPDHFRVIYLVRNDVRRS